MKTIESYTPSYELTEALGQSDIFLSFQEQLSQAAQIDRPVLLMGERGTGKELAAARLHYLSSRWQAPLVTLDGATLASTLAEDALFGHEAGAFTGATSRREGRFERANGGSIFLDEVGNLSLTMQEKLLRIIEYGHYERLGGNERLQADVRIIAATNANLAAMSKAGTFRADFLDRLSCIVIHVPPLRIRGDDILLLAEHFSRYLAVELNRPAPHIGQHARSMLQEYAWPGNIRELKSVIERATLQQTNGHIDSLEFSPLTPPWATLVHSNGVPSQQATSMDESSSFSASRTKAPSLTATNDIAHLSIPNVPFSLKEQRDILEQHALKQALYAARHNQRVAATLLGLTYDQFRGLYRRHSQALQL